MTISYYETYKSQSGSNSRNSKDSFDRQFIATASFAETLFQVEATVRAGLPDTVGTMVLTSVDASEMAESGTTRYWSVRARYRDPDHPDAREEKETGDYEVSFDTTGGTATRTHAISQVYYDDDSGIHKESKSLAIGWNGTEAKGTEVTIPTLQFQETHYIPDATVSNADWVKGVARATGKTNSEEFRGFDPGELLFLGASGSKRGKGDWPVTFYATASETAIGLMKGDIKVGVKKGQDHLWIEDIEELENNRLAPVPNRVYVAVIAESIDFNNFWPAKPS